MRSAVLAAVAASLLSACSSPVVVPDDAVGGAPAFSFAATSDATYYLELNEWAERHQLYISEESTADRKKLQLLIVGCAGDPECFFVHEAPNRTRVLEPRLKKDWTATLSLAATDAERLRRMSCVFFAGGGGACEVWSTERTRADLRASFPELARMMMEPERSPAEINLIKKNKR